MAASTPNKRPGLNLIEDELWYAGAISERKAEQILTKIGDKGVFLVRDSLLPDADYVLSVNGGSDIDHYLVKVEPSNECVLNNYTFATLPDAIEFYTENRLGRVYLNKPEEQVVADPVSLKGVGPKIGFAPVSPVHQQVPTSGQADSIDAPTAESKDSPLADNASKLQSEHREETTSEPQHQHTGSDSEADHNEGEVTQQSTKPVHSAATVVSTERGHEDSHDSVPQDTSEPASEQDNTETSPMVEQNQASQPKEETDQPSSVQPEKETDLSSSEPIVQPEKVTDQLAPEPVTEEHNSEPSPQMEALTNEETTPSSPQEKEPLHQEEAETDTGSVEPADSSPELLQLSPDDTPYTSVASDCSIGNKGIATLESSSSVPEVNSSSQTEEQAKSQTDTSTKQCEELKSLPSISDKKKALEQRLSNNGEEKVVKKAKVPPPVPRRTTFTDLSKTQSTETKQEEQVEPIPRRDDIVKSSIKNTPPPAPKRLFIPHSFQQKDDSDDDTQQKPAAEPPKRLPIPHNFQQTFEESDGPPENPALEQRTPRRLSIPQNFQKTEEEEKEIATSPTGPPKRLVIPESLRVQPPPPPLATHPGLAKKEEERQQQQAEAEKLERPQPHPQKSKKRRSLFGRKSKDSDKDKDRSGVKRKPSFKAEEPIPLEQAESLKQKQEQQEEKPPADPSPPRPKKVLGVPTLAVSPVALDASGGGAELESVFKIITKHDWHPEDSEVKEEIVHSTFGLHAIKLADPPVKKADDKPSEETKTKKDSVVETTTFKPKESSTSSQGDKAASFHDLDSPLPAGNTFNVSPNVTPKSHSQELVSSPTPIIGFIARPGSTLTETNSVTSVHSSGSSTPSTPKTPKEHATSPNTPPARKTTPSPASPTHLASVSQSAKGSPQPSPNRSSKGSAKSQSTGVLPSNSPVKPVHGFGHHHSLADVVPGIPTKTVSSLPRGLPSMTEDEVDSASSALPGVHVPSVAPRQRINTAPSRPKPEQGPMNTKRADKAAIKKRGSLFRKK